MLNQQAENLEDSCLHVLRSAGLEAFHGFFIIVSGVRQALNRILSIPVLDGMLEIYSLFGIGNVFLVMDRYRELNCFQ